MTDLLINSGGTLDLAFVLSASTPVEYDAIGNNIETVTPSCLKVGDTVHACGSAPGCPIVSATCNTVTGVTDTDSLQLAISPTADKGFISRAAKLASKKNRHGFRPILSLGRPTPEQMLGVGGVRAGTNRVIVTDCIEWEEGDRITLADAFPQGAEIKHVFQREGKSVLFVDRNAYTTIELTNCDYVMRIAKQPKTFYGFSNDCGGAVLRLSPKDLSDYLPGTRLPYKLELAWGWDYSEFNKKTGCDLQPSKAWSSLLKQGTAIFV